MSDSVPSKIICTIHLQNFYFIMGPSSSYVLILGTELLYKCIL
jgi:hypothetical protein